MIRLTYEFVTEDEMLRHLMRDRVQVAQSPSEDAEPASAIPPSPTQAPAAPRGRGRPPKAAAPATTGPGQEGHAPAATSAATPAAAAPQIAVPVSSPAEGDKPQPSGQKAESPATAAPTADTIRAALMKVFQASGGQGAAAATAILKKFNATRVSDIKPEQYADFLKACA